MKVRSRLRKHISWKMLGLEDKPSSCWTATFSGGMLYIIFRGVMIMHLEMSTKLRVKDETSSGLPWGDIVASREGFRCITSQKIWKTNPPRQKQEKTHQKNGCARIVLFRHDSKSQGWGGNMGNICGQIGDGTWRLIIAEWGVDDLKIWIAASFLFFKVEMHLAKAYVIVVYYCS